MLKDSAEWPGSLAWSLSPFLQLKTKNSETEGLMDSSKAGEWAVPSGLFCSPLGGVPFKYATWPRARGARGPITEYAAA